MRIVQAPRASAILYHVLTSQREQAPWLLAANICPIVPLTFLKACVPFEFVDISEQSLHMDLEQAESRIRRGKIAGLLYAHTYGEPSTPTDFFDRVKILDPDLLILDDRCLCIPEFEPGSSADVILFSTGYAKVVDLGSGGYALLRDHVAYEQTNLPFHKDHHDALEQAYKKAIQEQARFLYHDSHWLETGASVPKWEEYREQIERSFKSSLAQRAKLNEIYTSRLPIKIQLSQAYQSWRFNIRVRNKQGIMKAIFKAGLFASSHYASLAGIMADGEAPRAEALASEVINLFNDHYFDTEKAMQVCDLILENYEG